MTKSNTLNISVIIPFKDKSLMTIACLDTLVRYGAPVIEILLVSNNSSDSELKLVKKAAKKYTNAQVLEYNHAFNFQAINNWTVQKSKGKVIFLLNNDIELVSESSSLLRAMYVKSLEPETGAVGCVLLYEDEKTIQHGGVYLVQGGTADHLYIGKNLAKTITRINSKETRLPDIRNNLTVTAVTAAAVMIERAKYEEVNGLNESFIICGGDVDICLRLTAVGYPSLLIGYKSGYMIHKESKSRSLLAVPYVDFVESYKSYIKHFSIDRGDPSIDEVEILNAKS